MRLATAPPVEAWIHLQNRKATCGARVRLHCVESRVFIDNGGHGDVHGEVYCRLPVRPGAGDEIQFCSERRLNRHWNSENGMEE